MKRKKTKISRIISKYPKPVNLKEWSLLSRYELFCYIGLFVILFIVFILWNSPQKRSFSFRAEACPSEGQLSTLLIDLRLPMSSSASDTRGVCKYKATFRDFQESDSLLNRLSKSDVRCYVDSMFSSRLDVSRHQNNNIWCLTGEATMSGYLPLIMSNARPDTTLLPYIYKDASSHNNKNQIRSLFNAPNKAQITKDQIIRIKNSPYISPKDKDLIIRYYDNPFAPPLTIDDIISDSNEWRIGGIGVNTPLNKPRWWSLFDISQSYIDIHIKSYSFKETILTSDFVGPSDIYDLSKFVGAKKDYNHFVVTKDDASIKYSFQSGEVGIDETIRIYARFRDLENTQTIRLFALTAVLSSLFAVLLAFVIMFLYRLRSINGMDKIETPDDTKEGEKD